MTARDTILAEISAEIDEYMITNVFQGERLAAALVRRLTEEGWLNVYERVYGADFERVYGLPEPLYRRLTYPPHDLGPLELTPERLAVIEEASEVHRLRVENAELRARLTEEGHLPAPDDAWQEERYQATLHGAYRRLSDELKELARVIIEEIPGEPSRSEGAVDCAIRLLRAAYGPLNFGENPVSADLGPVSGPSGSSTPETPLDDTEAPRGTA